MGWKTINGNRYFYKSERSGGRVTTTYFGSGKSGALMAEILRIDNEDRLLESTEKKEYRDEWNEVEYALDDLVAVARRTASDVLTAAGYHRHHRGEWRRKRHV